MAITTLDGLIAGFTPPTFVVKNGVATTVGVWYSPFYVSGFPGAAAAPSPGIAGAALTTYAGQIPIPAASGNTHLARFSASCNVAGQLLLCDRLWHNSGISSTLTSAQTVNSVAWPARDKTGTTNGEDVYVGLEVSTVMGAGAGNATLTYTNSAGTGSRTSVAVYTATNAVGTFQWFTALSAGDIGIRSIQSLQWSVSRTSGTIHLVAFRVLAAVPIFNSNVPAALDTIALGMPRMYDNTVPFLLWLPTVTTAPGFVCHIGFSQG